MLKTHESGKEGERESRQKWTPPALVPSFRRTTGWIVVNQSEWEGERLRNLPHPSGPLLMGQRGGQGLLKMLLMENHIGFEFLDKYSS